MKRRIEYLYSEIGEINFGPAVIFLIIVTIPLMPFFALAWIAATLLEEPR
jgi:hypothetical protein